jgi:hypothetical protein
MIYDARAAAALSLFKHCLSRFLTNSIGGSCAIALIKPLALDRGYLFWPATGYWRRPDGSMEAVGPGS